MEWSDLRIFLAVARSGTLGAAARKLGQTQPTVGRRIRALEESVGHALFQRTTEGFVLTDEGATILRHAEHMEEEALAIERGLAGGEAQLTGLLRISSSDWFGVHMLTPVIAEFTTMHPHVTVELVTDARLLSLARREADLAFRIRRFDEPDVLQRKLMHVEYGLYGSETTAPPKAGDGSNSALLTMDTGFGDLPDAVWLKKMLPNARVAFQSNNRDAQAQACVSGAGIAVLPKPLAERTPGLRLIDLGAQPPGRDTWVGYHRDLKRLARLRMLLDMVIDRLAD
ncbi:MAG: LysR family transcriptional regulator [Xanthobacteraceae bacterium]|nr:LysR family transcriptional regulator [Xanthobacteraceae bacterium]